ncbi:MAG: ABC transporter permease [Phycisphaerae bacterium]|jgi:NitT/TauT family transport system substrate-binding protein|nr:MAG: ABC transporter permease [Phycisphaerae bacterium]
MIRLLSLSMICLVMILGCDRGSSEGSSDKTKLILQLNWKPEPQFGGFYAADYDRHGLNVEVRPGGAGTPTIELIGTGQIPFGIVSADEIPRARQQGAKVVALFAVYQTHPQGIMTRASRGFTRLEEVFSHEGILAMEKGLPYSDFLRNKYGFEKLKIVPSPFGDLSMYLKQENYAMQCFVTSEPLAAAKTNVPPKTFLIAESGYNPYATVLATSDEFLSQNPDICRKMVQAVLEGWQTYLNDPAPTNARMHELNPTMDLTTFQASADAQKPLIQTTETRQTRLGIMTDTRWKQLLTQLHELKVIDQPIQPAECYRDLLGP